MATVGELVTQAYRQENLVAVGQTPTTAQMTEGVARFNSIWRSLFGRKFGEKLLLWPVPPNPTVSEARDWPLLPRDISVPADAWPYPQQNSMLQVAIDGATTIYLKQMPSDGARMGLVNIGTSFATNPLTINGNGFLIDGAASLTLSAALTAPLFWFFRQDLGDWRRVTTLVAADNSPLPDDFDDFWRCAVAMALCPMYGKSPQAMTVQTFKDGLSYGVGRYAQEMPAANDPANLWSMPFQSFALPGWGTQW